MHRVKCRPSPGSRPSPVDQVRVPRRNRLSDLRWRYCKCCSDFVEIYSGPGEEMNMFPCRFLTVNRTCQICCRTHLILVIFCDTTLWNLPSQISNEMVCLRVPRWFTNTIVSVSPKLCDKFQTLIFWVLWTNHLQLLTSAKSNLQWNGDFESSSVK